MNRTSRSKAVFFARLLTLRQKLTLRSIAAPALGLLTIAAGIPIIRSLTATSPVASQPADSAANQPAARLLSVQTSRVAEAGPEFLTQNFTGTVVARRVADVAPKSPGRVMSIEVQMGDRVQPGQPLFQLDIAQSTAARDLAQASLSAARARFEELAKGPRTQDIDQAVAQVGEISAQVRLSEATFRRTSQLWESQAVSKQTFDEAKYQLEAIKAKLNSAETALKRLREGSRKEQIASQAATVRGLEARLRSVEADLDQRTIKAPFGGHIQSRLVDPGTVVAPGQTILQLVESAPYEVRVGLPADVAARLDQDSSSCNIRVFSNNRPLTAQLARMSPTVSQTTRTREVVLLLTESSSQQAGLGAAVRVQIDQPVDSTGMWVPTTALTAGPRGLWAVYVASPISADAPLDSSHSNPHEIQMRQVELLRSGGEWSEIRGPISRQELLVTRGTHRVTPGQHVVCSSNPTATLPESN